MNRQEQIQEELAYAEHYDAKARREADPFLKSEWEAQAQRARDEAARLMQQEPPRLASYGEVEPGRGTG